jgi:hypothetical protein
MSYKYVITFDDDSTSNSSLFDTVEEVYAALPFDWKYYEEVIGGDRIEDVKYLKEQLDLECAISVYDARIQDLFAIKPIAYNVADVTIEIVN